MEDIDIVPALKEYVETKEAIDQLGRKLSKLRAAIIEWHGEDLVKTADCYQSKLSNCTKVTLLESVAASRHGITFDDADYKVTPYTKISVKRM